VAYHQKRLAFPDPTTLIIIDEADRLKMAALEQVRDIFDHGGLGVVFSSIIRYAMAPGISAV
jgi:DNA transposition AAA+ family ATPase